MSFRQIFLKLCVVFSLALPFFAEDFRVHAVVPVQFSDIFSETKCTAGINDAIFITLPADMTYVSGIELHFKVPEIVAAWRDTIAYSLYEPITPRPSEKQIDYSGSRISVGTFPGKLSHTIYIPLSEQMEIKNSPYYEKIAVQPNSKQGFIFFRMQLAMKGVPEEFENALFEITAKPVLIEKGKLRLFVIEPKEKKETYSVFIDSNPFTASENGNLLSMGEHHLSISSENYRNEVRTFRIEQAKETVLTIPLRGIEPTIKLVSPENAQVFFDGVPVENARDAFEISQGEHIVKFIIGDYEVVRNITAVNGRSYTVNLSIDAAVTEDE